MDRDRSRAFWGAHAEAPSADPRDEPNPPGGIDDERKRPTQAHRDLGVGEDVLQLPAPGDTIARPT